MRAFPVRTICRTAACILVGASVVLAAPDPNVQDAEKLYHRTAYGEALRLLEAAPQKTAAVYELMGKCFYGMENYKSASESFERAVAADPRSPGGWDWLGKAYGKRAETSSFFTAPSYASKARKAFERALDLDPQNRESIDDLFDYSLEAPGFLGGGLDKAAALSEKIRDRDPAKYHAMKARLAEKRKEFSQAEQFWRQAAQLAPSQAGRLADLAKFLARRGRFAESEDAFERAGNMAPSDPELKFERAKTYIESKRNRDQARKLLEEYLKSSLTPDDPSRAEAERLLKSIGSEG